MLTEPVSPEAFEPSDFWVEHKTKIIAYAALLITAVGGYGIFEISQQRKAAASEELYAKAASIAEFRTVAQQFPGTRVGGNSALELAELLRIEKKYDEAVTTLRDFMKNYPEHPLLCAAWTSLAATYEMQGKLDEALDTYQQAAIKFPDAYTTSVAMMSQGRILEMKGKKDDAKRVYQDVVARYGDSIFAREAMREMRFLKK